ncbi:aromatic amino acid ammonia-lyase [Cloacibacillus sp. An23]|uniref:HAL/PAL/TAL family ammonia-lyase n=1 Tax=Cloacibacillus sp. An23 TaxID=1965591 RepID=UPI00210166AE|nr:aromatic amino acid ammonia-lyase [Cloacibacillus sp. An23]
MTLVEFIAIVRYNSKVVLTPEYVERVKKSRTLVEKFLNENRAIYGLTTGFGDNVRKVIPQSEAERLQRNIIRSHAVSVGEPLSEEGVRALWLMQLLSLGRGYSGIRPDVLTLIAECLNRKVYPYAPSEGSIQNLPVEGYVNLVLMGEGQAWLGNQLVTGHEALKSVGLDPLSPACKEGLCLTNGINGAEGLALIALHDSILAAQTADISGAMAFEVLRGTLLGCDYRLHSLKEHPEQAGCAANIRLILSDSEIAANSMYHRVQDPYVIRCIPHVHGAAKRFMKDVSISLIREMLSCNDNPIVWPDGNGEGLMGSNFDGTYVGAGSDILCMACANIAKISERRTDKLTNQSLSGGYPAFLADKPGVDNGYMIAQYTASALVNEIRGLCIPATSDSVPVSANWEDPISMAWWAAMKAVHVACKLQYVIAIELMTMSRAFDLTRVEYGHFSSATQSVHDKIREVVPYIKGDRYLGPDIEAIYSMVKNGDIVKNVQARIGTTLAF